MSVDLLTPIPCLDAERELKPSYMGHPIDQDSPIFNEPLVPVSNYGLDGVNYYSQPNSVTGGPVEGMTPHVFVRRTVAEKLEAVNCYLLESDEVARLFDTHVQLYIRDGFRPPQLQAYLHGVYIPQLLRTQNPEWSETEVLARRDQVIARPKQDSTAVSPHATGGAVDLIIVSADDGSIINTGFHHVTLGEKAIHTDYLEGIDVEAEDLIQAMIARRIVHNVMISDEVGAINMQNNPTETWHYSYGDQMWALLGGHPAAFYGLPPEIPDELVLNN